MCGKVGSVVYSVVIVRRCGAVGSDPSKIIIGRTTLVLFIIYKPSLLVLVPTIFGSRYRYT